MSFPTPLPTSVTIHTNFPTLLLKFVATLLNFIIFQGKKAHIFAKKTICPFLFYCSINPSYTTLYIPKTSIFEDIRTIAACQSTFFGKFPTLSFFLVWVHWDPPFFYYFFILFTCFSHVVSKKTSIHGLSTSPHTYCQPLKYL